MITYNHIKYKLIDFFNSHAQIKDMKYEDDFDFNAERNLSYPVCNIEYLESNISNRTITHSYKVVLGDRMDDNTIGIEDEIYSDMLMIAEDFFTFLQYSNDFSFNKSTNIQKFVDDTSDRVAGVVFKISLTVTRLQNECATPTI